jgi:hypothetical protein
VVYLGFVFRVGKIKFRVGKIKFRVGGTQPAYLVDASLCIFSGGQNKISGGCRGPPPPPNGKCIMPGLYPYFLAAYAIIIAAIIPPSMMITFTILAAKNIRQIRRRVHPGIVDTTTTKNTSVRLKQYDYQLVKMLVVDVTIYCILIIPSPMYYIYAAVTLKSSKTAEQLAWQSFSNYLTYQFLLYVSVSTSFYTNILVSKAFRVELRLFLNRYLLRRSRPIPSHSNNNNPNLPMRLRTITTKDDVRPAKAQH